MTREVEDRIVAAAARQHGVLTRQQLLAAGLSRCALEYRLESGRLRVLHRGVYLGLLLPLPHTRDMAAVLASGPGAVLSHFNAASLWGVRAAEDGPVHVWVTGNRGQRPGIRAHRGERLAADERTVRAGIPVTSAARTLLDLATVLDRDDLEAAVARAERERLVTPEALETLLARHFRERGAGGLRAVLRLEGGPALTRSTAEAKLLALVREAHLPPPECNVNVGRYEVDFLWRASRLAVEVDGYQYHAPRPRFEGDRRKDAELVAAGVTVLHLSWRQITAEAVATAVQLGRALDHATDRRRERP